MIVCEIEDGSQQKHETHIGESEEAELIGQSSKQFHLALEFLDLGLSEEERILDEVVLDVRESGDGYGDWI